MKKGTIAKLIGTLVLIGAVGAAGWWGWNYVQDKGFRVIAVDEVVGQVEAKGTLKSGQLSKGEHLYDGDSVDVLEASGLTLCTDKTRYMYCDPNTSFDIEASGGLGKDRLVIKMTAGSTLHVLNEKLAEGETYEVTTPTATMSVRGTTFRVTVYKATDGSVYALTEVKTGKVDVKLKDKAGKYTGEVESFTEGQSALTRIDDEKTEFVLNEDGEIFWVLDYDRLPEDSIQRLVSLLEDEPMPEAAPAPIPEAAPAPIPVPEPEPEPEEEVEVPKEHVHTFGDWTIITEGNCTDPGTRQHACTECGFTETESYGGGGEHDMRLVSQTEATCEDSNHFYYECANCGYSYDTSTEPALGHDFQLVEETQATCTEGAYTRYECSRCPASEESATPPLGHYWDGNPIVMNGGADDAHSRSATCGRCGQSYYCDENGNPID